MLQQDQLFLSWMLLEYEPIIRALCNQACSTCCEQAGFKCQHNECKCYILLQLAFKINLGEHCVVEPLGFQHSTRAEANRWDCRPHQSFVDAGPLTYRMEYILSINASDVIECSTAINLSWNSFRSSHAGYIQLLQ